MVNAAVEEVLKSAQQRLGWLPIGEFTYNNVGEFFSDVCAQYGQRVAFSALGAEISYTDALSAADNLAAYLVHELGLKQGDKVIVQLPNVIQYPIAAMACVRAGMTMVNTNPMYTRSEFLHQANDSGAVAMITNAVSASTIDSIVADTGIKHVIVSGLGDMLPSPKRQLVNFVLRYVRGTVKPYHFDKPIAFRDALAKGAKHAFTPATTQLDDIAVLQYTGGTTGVAKGAMLTHKNLLANLMQFDALMTTIDFSYDAERLVLPLPLYHIYAFMVCLVVMGKGGELVLITDPRDRPSLVKTLAKKPFNYFVGLNTLFVALCNDESFKQLDFSALKATMSGGMALTPEAARIWKRVTGCNVVEGYGLTETSPLLCANSGREFQIGSIGVPAPNTEVRIVGDDGADCGIGEPGELVVRGPQVMPGYWQRPEATAEVLSEDGWFATGDIALVQADGFVKIVDRKKDMIIVSGFNVFPNEVEAVLVEHPDIIETAVIGVKDSTTGEQVKAFVVATNPDLALADVRAYCKERLAAYKIPTLMELRDDLPKTAVGKILRKELRD